MAKKFPDGEISVSTPSNTSYTQDAQNRKTEMDETGGAFVAMVDSSGQPYEHSPEFYSKPSLFT